MVHDGDAAHLHVTTKNTNKLTQYTKKYDYLWLLFKCECLDIKSGTNCTGARSAAPYNPTSIITHTKN